MSIFSIFTDTIQTPDLSELLRNEKFNNFISNAEDISIGYSELKIFKAYNIQYEQITIHDAKAKRFSIGNKLGDWKKSWVVIGVDFLGDLLFVDSEIQNSPVFVSECRNGMCKKSIIANSIENFNQILIDLKNLSKGRENPKLIEKNPISDTELEIVLSKIKAENNGIDFEYWEIFLEKDL